MTFTTLLATGGVSASWETFNENFRRRSHLNYENVAFADSPFTAWASETDGQPIDAYECDATAGAIVLQLPTYVSGDASLGRAVTLTKTDASGNAVTVTADGVETINGATTKVLSAQYDSVTIAYLGNEWRIIAEV